MIESVVRDHQAFVRAAGLNVDVCCAVNEWRHIHCGHHNVGIVLRRGVACTAQLLKV